MRLMHGTTRLRAEAIIRDGPVARYREAGGAVRDEGFSMSVASGPFYFGTPDEYAVRKARLFPDEGGAAVLSIEVPDEVISQTDLKSYPISQGLIQFFEDDEFAALLAAWPTIRQTAVIRSLP